MGYHEIPAQEDMRQMAAVIDRIIDYVLLCCIRFIE